MKRSSKYVSARALVLIVLLALASACASGPNPANAPIQSGAPQHLPEDVTLLPILDSRTFLASGQKPDLTADVPISISADEVLNQGNEAWQREGLGNRILPYHGAAPDAEHFKWAEFPLYQLTTDLGFGLEIKSLTLKETGHNAYLAPHALVDAVLLPFFSLAAAASDGHWDLGGWVIPSTMVKFTTQVNLAVVSVKGGGQIFGKTYLVSMIDPAVNENQLYEGFRESPLDGQELARSEAPQIIDDVFTLMARDPELPLLPLYARAAWLSRVLKEDRVPDRVKVDLVRTVLDRNRESFMTGPDDSAAVSGNDGGPRHVDPTEQPFLAEAAKSRATLFKLYYFALLECAGRLERHKTDRALSASEVDLYQAVMKALNEWTASRAGNNLARTVISRQGANLEEKKAAVKLMAYAPDSFDNRGFLARQVELWVDEALDGSGTSVQAAAMVLAAGQGPRLVSAGVSPRVLLGALSSDDGWAEDLVMTALDKGNLGPDTVRLVGALKMERATSRLLSVLDTLLTRAASFQPQETLIAVEPTPPPEIRAATGPDPVLILRTLGRFPADRRLQSRMRSIIDDWFLREDAPEDVAAEAVRSLARQGQKRLLPGFLSMWEQLVRENHGPLVRRAVLEAVGLIGDHKDVARVLRIVDARLDDADSDLASVREAADFFGHVRYEPAVPFLLKAVRHGSGETNLRQAAFHALSAMATGPAEQGLTDIATGQDKNLAFPAAQALNDLVAEKALWRGLAAEPGPRG